MHHAAVAGFLGAPGQPGGWMQDRKGAIAGSYTVKPDCLQQWSRHAVRPGLEQLGGDDDSWLAVPSTRPRSARDLVETRPVRLSVSDAGPGSP